MPLFSVFRFNFSVCSELTFIYSQVVQSSLSVICHKMPTIPQIEKIEPSYAVRGGLVEIFPKDLIIEPRGLHVEFDGEKGNIEAASSKKILVTIPYGAEGETDCRILNGDVAAEPFRCTIGMEYNYALHNVGNPAIGPDTDAIWVTRSGSRGYQIPNPICRIESSDYFDELPVEILNPSGFAFSPSGKLYVTNRANGELYHIKNDHEADCVATGLGTATGLAFDRQGELYIGDRAGTIYRMEEDGMPEIFTTMSPSVAAYHLAFGPDGRLFVTAPGLTSYDAVYAIDERGNVETWIRGFGRPQGIAFDKDGNLYIAAFHGGRRGIFRISPEKEITWVVAAADPVGLCFDRNGRMIIATQHAVFSLEIGVFGTLLDN